MSSKTKRAVGETWSDEIEGLAPSAVPLMVVLPRGEFVIGTSSHEPTRIFAEGPQVRVGVRYTLAVGVHPVTVEQFAAFVAGAGHSTGDRAAVNEAGKGGSRVIAGAGWQNPGYAQTERCPVTCVNWHDANAYLAWLNARLDLTGKADAYRLLSEAEWEYACRANPKGGVNEPPFSFGRTISAEQANFKATIATEFNAAGEFRGATTPAGAFPHNAFGLHDMHGNVWEWCEDLQTDHYKHLPRDGQPQRVNDTGETGRVIRGGSWINDASVLRSGYRSRTGAIERENIVGFRIARTLSR